MTDVKAWNIVYPKTARRAAIMLLSLLLAAQMTHAQKWPFELWHEGKIVLLEGDTLKGLVKYDLQQDLLQYNFGDQKVVAYSPRKVLFFEIFDRTVNRYRQFFALPYKTNSNYQSTIFFELMVEGKITLLAREELVTRSYTSAYYMGPSYTRTVLEYRYFFMKENGDITEFTGNKNDLLDQMGKNAEDVEKYAKSNRLRWDDKYDFARIVSYYNSLF